MEATRRNPTAGQKRPIDRVPDPPSFSYALRLWCIAVRVSVVDEASAVGLARIDLFEIS